MLEQILENLNKNDGSANTILLIAVILIVILIRILWKLTVDYMKKIPWRGVTALHQKDYDVLCKVQSDVEIIKKHITQKKKG